MTDNQIYKGGEKETREAMSDAFVSGDWSGWKVSEIGSNNQWHAMLCGDYALINNPNYQFRRKPRTMTINGVEVPVPDSIYSLRDQTDMNVGFKSEADRDQFEAAMREVREGGE